MLNTPLPSNLDYSESSATTILMALTLPVVELNGAEHRRADSWVGSDGMARKGNWPSLVFSLVSTLVAMVRYVTTKHP